MEINQEQINKLKEVLYMHLNNISIIGGQNAVHLANAFVKLQTIIEEVEKQGITVINPIGKGGQK